MRRRKVKEEEVHDTPGFHPGLPIFYPYGIKR
jgi:hypothetical protein